MPTVLAIAAHADDIEFMMAGTLLLLADRGLEIHYWNLADGRCGSNQMDGDEVVAVRAQEARSASSLLGAHFHPPVRRDLEIFYETDLVRRVCALVRSIAPDFVLLQSPQDYMEDHMNACRVAVTAVFARGMRNYPSIPEQTPIDKDVAVYHALPYGLQDQLCRPVRPHFLVDIGESLERKLEMLACHRSQRRWLDVSQGLDSYLETARGMSGDVAGLYGRAERPASAPASTPPAAAEGWRRHLPLGFHRPGYDPLAQALAELVIPVGD